MNLKVGDINFVTIARLGSTVIFPVFGHLTIVTAQGNCL